SQPVPGLLPGQRRRTRPPAPPRRRRRDHLGGRACLGVRPDAACPAHLPDLREPLTRPTPRLAPRREDTMTETADGRECGHEHVIGGVAYGCERPPHPVDGYGPT